MQITLAQLVVGFQSAMNINQLADSLGVPQGDVIDRLKSLTPEEEQFIHTAMEGLP